jgi:hypothetical protein
MVEQGFWVRGALGFDSINHPVKPQAMPVCSRPEKRYGLNPVLLSLPSYVAQVTGGIS